MNGTILIALGGLALVVFWVLWTVHKEKNRQDQVHTTNLDDEFLYDPQSGKKYTIEEAEQGEINFAIKDTVKSEEEIRKYFTEDAAELERAKNYMRRKGYKRIELEETEFDQLMALEWWTNYQNVYLDSVYSVPAFGKFCFIEVTYKIPGGKGALHIHTEAQITLWTKKTQQQKLEHLEKDKSVRSLETGDLVFYTINKIANEGLVKYLLNNP